MSPARVAAKGRTLVDGKGTTLHFRQGCRRKVDVQRPLRGKLATLDGDRGRQAKRRLDDPWLATTRKMMWAHKGKPLYTWKKDAAPGDTTGDGFNNGVLTRLPPTGGGSLTARDRS